MVTTAEGDGEDGRAGPPEGRDPHRPGLHDRIAGPVVLRGEP